jgi:hypothetical protein
MDGYNNSIWSFIVFLSKRPKNLKPQISNLSQIFSRRFSGNFEYSLVFSQMLEGGWINTRSIEVCY